MDTKTNSLWHTSSNESIWKPEKVSSAHELVEIKSQYSLVSNGTERTVCMANIPEAAFSRMEVPYMEGNFSLPVKYGYSLVGEIITEGHPQKNQLVHLLHPHQDICLVSNVDFSLVPTDIPAARATLASNMETAVNGLWDSGISVGDRALIVGGGLVGILIGKLLSTIPGVHVAFAELDPGRKELLNSLGFEILKPSNQSFDLAFHTSGSGSGLELAINAVGLEGKIIELSWYADKRLDLKLGNSFHYDRKQLISSQVGIIPGNKSNRWNYKRRKDTVFDILKDKWYDQLLSPMSMQETITHFENLRNNKSVPVAPVIKY